MGMALNYLSLEGKCVAGITFSAKSVLRFGIALLGARITVEQLMGLGVTPIAIVAVAVPSTILAGYLLGKWLKISPSHSILTAASVGICGASAAIAVSAVLPQNKEAEKNLIFTVIAVTALSTVAMIMYPLVVTYLGFSASQSGIFMGATIHDVAQVVGAGYMMSDDIGDVATFTKLLRVAMLVPVVIVISLVVARRGASDARPDAATGGFPLPGFLVAFMVIVGINSMGGFSAEVAVFLVDTSRWCLIIAMVGLGMKASFADLVKMGWRPLALMVGETLFLAVLVAVWLKFF
jgi:uncharacterized integral membrane protein (TIGR00698 family)